MPYSRKRFSFTNSCAIILNKRKPIFRAWILLSYLLIPLYSVAQFNPGAAYFGNNDYIEYHAGNLPIIISAPHGGYLTPDSIPDRVCGNCVTIRDSWTEELAYEIDSAIRVVFGGYPHIIINKLSRKKLDANRAIGEAALGNSLAETAWHEYHEFIQAAKDSCVAKFGSAIFIDLHAHGHAIQRIELGYLLTRTELQFANGILNSQNFQDSSSIKHLTNILNPSTSFSDLLRGNDCMGELLNNRGYPSVPSLSDPAPLPTEPYFSGGYNTARHGSQDSTIINAIQFETNYTGIRNTHANRNAFARSLACVLRTYLDQWYFDLDNWDPGHLVTSNEDAGPGSLRSALLGAEDGSVITFAPALYGDTIRLEDELQICNDITIQGPGKDLLTISGEDQTRILRIMPGSHTEISGLSLSDGHSPIGEDGGAVLTYGSIRLSHCRLENNYAEDDGGAIAAVDSLATVRLDTCILLNNSCGDDGGALRCFHATLMVNATTVEASYSPSYGGGISSNGMVTITNSTFTQNHADYGGAIRSFGAGLLTCINTTIEGNIGDERGAGISTVSSVDLNFCTIVNNQSTGLGGGIRVATGGSCRIKNTLVAGNSSSNGDDVSVVAGVFISQGYNLIGDTTSSNWAPAIGDQLGNTNNPIDPMVMPLDSNGGPTMTIHLQVNSPCIDQADTTDAPQYDQRGNIRVSGSKPDIGALEFCIPTQSIDTYTACGEFIWIDGNTYTHDDSTATYIVENAAGCDSVITLNLTIQTIDTAITQSNNTLLAQAIGVSYQWLDCNKGSQMITGQTNQSFTPSETGNYAVEITQNDCKDTSACYAISTVGILGNSFKEELLVYPNPTSGQMIIDLRKSHPLINLKIFNSIGQLTQSEIFTDSQKIDLNIEGKKGYYFVEIYSGEKQKTVIKILKE